MATKYNRDVEARDDPVAGKTPWARQGPLMRPPSRRLWLFVIAASIAAVVLAIQVPIRLRQSGPYANQPVKRGIGAVVARGVHEAGADGAPGRGEVMLEIPLDDGRRIQARGWIPDPYWNELAIGSHIAVLYQLDRTGREIRVLECGVVALGDDMR